MPVEVYACRPGMGYIPDRAHMAINSLMEFDRSGGRFVRFYRERTGTAIHWARRDFVRDFLKSPCSHLLFIDSDMSPPPNGLHLLVEAERPIVSGLFTNRGWQRGGAIEPQIKKRILDLAPGGGHRYVAHPEIPDDEESLARVKLIEADAVGMAFTLVAREVFETVEEPWFKFESDEGVDVGEDVYFCEKARAAGFPIWCRLDCVVGHEGHYTYDIRDAWEFKRIREEERRAVQTGHPAVD